MSAIQVVPAAPGDVPVILRMIRGLAEYERLAHVVVATEDRLRGTLFGPHPAAEVLLANLAGECVGFALFFQTYSTFLAQPGAWLEDLFVTPEARGRGAGIALLAELARIAVERGYGRLEWSVLTWNEPSIQFYEKLGAAAMDDWTMYRLTGDALGRLAARAV